ncbi:MAG: DUF72 domain-containing protein [Treponema sp.]|nr:DUF72 domain-containing protein [Treponema sp.]
MIEFRHKEWIRESVFEGLEKRKAGIVFCDMPMCHLAQMSIISNYANGAKRRMPQQKNLPDGTVMGTPFIGENAYIRLHGRNEGRGTKRGNFQMAVPVIVMTIRMRSWLSLFL